MKLLVLLVLCGATLGDVSTDRPSIPGQPTLWTTSQKNLACMPHPDSGPCRGLFPRYYYSVEEETCLPFLYGGCKGNLNNYETFDECKHSCAPMTERERNCLGRPERGPCKSNVTMWGYNAALNECVKFIYGGCDGNENKYGTKKMCETVCKSARKVHPRDNPFILGDDAYVDKDSDEDIDAVGVPFWPFKPEMCTYSPDSGPCLAPTTRFFYNTLTSSCERFVYGGCGGNENNFRSIAECNTKCVKFIAVIPRA